MPVTRISWLFPCSSNVGAELWMGACTKKEKEKKEENSKEGAQNRWRLGFQYYGGRKTGGRAVAISSEIMLHTKREHLKYGLESSTNAMRLEYDSEFKRRCIYMLVI